MIKPYLFAAALLMMSVGCITPQFIADQAGYLSGTGYLVANDPPVDEVKAVRSVVDKVTAYTGTLDQESTFTSLYGPLSKEVAEELEGKTRVLALNLTRTLLDGLDQLFIANPEWAEKRDLVVDLAASFLKGAGRAFDRYASDPNMKAGIARVKAASAGVH